LRLTCNQKRLRMKYMRCRVVMKRKVVKAVAGMPKSEQKRLALLVDDLAEAGPGRHSSRPSILHHLFIPLRTTAETYWNHL